MKVFIVLQETTLVGTYGRVVGVRDTSIAAQRVANTFSQTKGGFCRVEEHDMPTRVSTELIELRNQRDALKQTLEELRSRGR